MRRKKLDWQKNAREMAFPFLRKRLPFMQRAHQNLLAGCEAIFEKARKQYSIQCLSESETGSPWRQPTQTRQVGKRKTLEVSV